MQSPTARSGVFSPSSPNAGRTNNEFYGDDEYDMTNAMGGTANGGGAAPPEPGSEVRIVHGNELLLFQKREAPLVFMEPYFCPNTMHLTQLRLDNVPIRMTKEMLDVRSEDMQSYAQRKMKDIRRMKHEFTERIKEVIERQKREELERSTKPKDRMRWWHRKTAPELRDPLKLVRFNNLTVIPENLLNTKDIVILNLTGCKLGDEAMSWVGAFIQQSYTIKRVNLQGNFLTHEGCQELYTGLRNTKTLMDLDLSLNNIGDDGVSVICNALVENTRSSKVYKLNVSTCNLSSSAGYNLARLIRESKTLTCLLAWRNRLGVGKGAKQSGAAMILEELRNSRMRLVDLTANNITDRDASDHAQMYEIEARKLRLMEIEKRQSIERLEQLRNEIKEKRRSAVWDDEKVAIGRLEKEAEQLKAKIRITKDLEQRKRTYDQKKELEYRERVKLFTGVELIDPKVRIRLILTGNHSIMPQTMKRLAAFYDMAKEPDYVAFVERKRRYDNILQSRRKVGDEYTLRDPEAYDEHNCLPWDRFDPDEDYRRRQALLQWREEERIKEEQMRPVKFEKFKLNAPEPPAGLGKNAKVVAGIGVASGVNARVRMTRAEEKPRELPKPKVRTETNVATGPTSVTTTVETEIDPEPEVIVMKKDAQGRLVPHPPSADDAAAAASGAGGGGSPRAPAPAPAKSAPAVEATPANSKARAEDDVSSSSDESTGEGDGFWKGPTGRDEKYEPLIPGSARRGDSDEETDEDEEGGSDDSGEVEAFAADEWEEREMEEHEWMQEKLRQRTEEVRLHVNARATLMRATPRAPGASGSEHNTPRIYSGEGIVAVRPVFSSGEFSSAHRTTSNLSTGGGGGGASAAASGAIPIPAALAPGGEIVIPIVASDLVATSEKVAPTAVVVPALNLKQSDDGDFKVIGDAMIDIARRREEIVRLGEIGSPSDEDIRRRERAIEELGHVKRELAKSILALPEPCAVPPVHLDPLCVFIESLVAESDATPGNTELFDAFMANVNLDFPALIAERGLAATAAIDGSISYLEVMLAAPILVGGDLMELIYACVFNQAARVPLAKLLLDKNIDFASVFEEVMPVMQEFFEDIASSKRAIPKEDRRDVREVIRGLMAHPVIGPNLAFEEEGADAQTAFSRACYEGDVELMTLMLNTGRVTNVNMVKSDDTTPLMQAVFSNSPQAVARLLEVPGIDVSYAHPENGNALDLAVGLKRDPMIATLLKNSGAKSSGAAAKAPAKLPGKKTIKVKVAVPKSKTAAPPPKPAPKPKKK